jgi:hypothetical protein
MDLESNWEALLESEGLGLIEPEQSYQDVGSARRKPSGKWSRLEAELNGITNPREFMCFRYTSPETACGVETAASSTGSEQPTYQGYDDDCLSDTVLESLQLSLTATGLEASIADRRRGAICGLDHENRPVRLRIPRRHREPGKVWRDRILKHIIGEQPSREDGPVWSALSLALPPHATADAGSGPLSIKDPIVGPSEIGGSRDDDVSDYPIKVVDTHTYLPGRSPFQMSRFASSNSDITG